VAVNAAFPDMVYGAGRRELASVRDGPDFGSKSLFWRAVFLPGSP
jgi:hypothetical protein